MTREKEDFPSQRELRPWRVYSLSLFTQHKCGHQFTSVSLCFDTTIKGFHFIRSLINWDRLVFSSVWSFFYGTPMLPRCTDGNTKRIKRFHIKLQWSVQTRNQGQSLFLHSSRPCGIPAHKPTPHTVKDRWYIGSLLLASACDFQSFLLFLAITFQACAA